MGTPNERDYLIRSNFSVRFREQNKLSGWCMSILPRLFVATSKKKKKQQITPCFPDAVLFFVFDGWPPLTRAPPPRHPQIPLRVSLRQLYEGDTFDTVYIRQAMCVAVSQCEKKCKDCQGPGIAVRMHQLGPGFVQQVQVRFFFYCCGSGSFFFALFSSLSQQTSWALSYDLVHGKATLSTVLYLFFYFSILGHSHVKNIALGLGADGAAVCCPILPNPRLSYV